MALYRGPGGLVRTKRGGVSLAEWKRLTVDPGAISDPGSLTTTGTSFDPQTGRMTIAYNAAHVTIVDGYQEAIARWTYPIASLLPTYNPDEHDIELWIDCPAWVHQASVAAGVFFGVVDSTVVDANLKGAMVELRTSTVATDLIGLTDPASNPITSSPGLVDGVVARLMTGSDGTGYPFAVSARGLIEGTSRGQQACAGQDSDNVLRTPVSNWQFTFGAWHGSVTAPTGVVQVCDLYYRQL